jgi:hypothetical protein
MAALGKSGILCRPRRRIYATVAFYYYDFALTLAAEVAHVWPQPISMNTFLFFSNRYVSFSGNIVVFILLFTPLVDSEVS